MHYYQFNIGDYASHTKGLSLIEDLAYRRLIDEYYLHERPFNGCSTDVARVIGMRDHSSEVDYILKRFFEQEDGVWVHKKIENDIISYKNKLEKASIAGKASAKSRKKTKVSNRRSTDVKQALSDRSTDVQPTNNHKPITNNHKPIVKNIKKDFIFEVFEYWKERRNHPKAILNKKRKTAIQAAIKEGYSPERIMKAIDNIENSPWHMGDNPGGTIYDDIELICRNGTQIEKFENLTQKGKTNGTSKAEQRQANNKNAIQEWYDEEKALELRDSGQEHGGSDNTLPEH